MATIEELRAQIAALEREAQQQDREKRAAQSEAWKVLASDPAAWEWQALPAEYRQFQGEVLYGVRVLKRMRQELLAKWREGGPSTFSSDMQAPERWHGMFYYRTDEGILTQDGGGTLVLKTPKLCSDAEWTELVAGRVPEKFKR